MEIKVKSCNRCPFHTYHMDSWDRDCNECSLIQHLNDLNKVYAFNNKEHNYFIDFYKNGKVKSKNKKTLDNCPLLKEQISVNYENYKQ